ncbi:hypothetical protein [Streptomyces sp. NPDC093591]|uniref:hypothetical protein n=1 Tax=Streptomyces sp. NPDC093591 TaxID=3366044 RepID=UPI003821F9E4
MPGGPCEGDRPWWWAVGRSLEQLDAPAASGAPELPRKLIVDTSASYVPLRRGI